MTVKELREALASLDDNLRVCHEDDIGGDYDYVPFWRVKTRTTVMKDDEDGRREMIVVLE